MLEVKDLQVKFNTKGKTVHAVRGISFKLCKGETLAIVGESGSGKSVTSRAIMGLLGYNAETSGEIVLEGDNLLSLSEEELCKIRGKRIAMVFQDPFSSLDPIMRVGEQLTEAMDRKSLSKSQRLEKAIRLMSEVGIPEPEKRISQYPFELSGGMRQRIVIAIALASDPDILICDEPTTALDVTIQAQILELIEGLKRQRRLSVIFITHDLGVVAKVADRVAVMYAGKIVEVGTVHEIFYESRHPYTWALLSCAPSLDEGEKLQSIEGSAPDLSRKIVGDAFAPRNEYALNIDFVAEPPEYKLSETHSVFSWLMHENAPRVKPPERARRGI